MFGCPELSVRRQFNYQCGVPLTQSAVPKMRFGSATPSKQGRMEYLAKLFVYWLLLVHVFAFVTPTVAEAQTSRIGNVVDNFLIPIPVPTGICSDGNSLWIPNYSAVSGRKQIYKLDIWTHQIIDSIRALDSTPSGLAWDGGGIWAMSTYPYSPFVSPWKTSLVKLSTSDSILSYIPATYSCYWGGIAWDGRNLYYGTNVCFASPAGQKSMVYKVNPANGAVTDSFPPPTGNINGLVYDRGNLWYCDDNNGYIFKIDTAGRILYDLDLPRSDLPFRGPLTGLAIARGYLWAVDMAGVGGPRVYEIDIGETPDIPELIHCDNGEDIPRKIKLGWLPSSSSNVERYRIYRDGPFDQGFGDLARASVIDSVTSGTTAYIDSTVQNGFAYAYWISAVDSDGVESHVSNGAWNVAFPFFALELGQNYPNPFNSSTTIPYEVSSPWSPVTHVTITVYDVLGRKVVTLVDRDEAIGDKTVVFNGHNLPSGVYFYRMQSGTFVETKKFMLIK
jgi:Secretion system C-terminal sorting domain